MSMQTLKPFRLWIYRVLTYWLPETRGFAFKRGLLRWAGATIGQNVRINSSSVFAGNGTIIIEDDVWIGAWSYLSANVGSTLLIKSHTGIAPQVTISTGTHELGTGVSMVGEGISKSVTIGGGCWIGIRAMIMPGVTLGDKTLVAAGAVVTKSFPQPRSFVVGVPATLKKML